VLIKFFEEPKSFHVVAKRTFTRSVGPLQAQHALEKTCCICKKRFVGTFSSTFSIYAHIGCINEHLVNEYDLNREFGTTVFIGSINIPNIESVYFHARYKKYWKLDNGIVRKEYTVEWNRIHNPILLEAIAQKELKLERKREIVIEKELRLKRKREIVIEKEIKESKRAALCCETEDLLNERIESIVEYTRGDVDIMFVLIRDDLLGDYLKFVKKPKTTLMKAKEILVSYDNMINDAWVVKRRKEREFQVELEDRFKFVESYDKVLLKKTTTKEQIDAFLNFDCTIDAFRELMERRIDCFNKRSRYGSSIELALTPNEVAIFFSTTDDVDLRIKIQAFMKDDKQRKLNIVVLKYRQTKVTSEVRGFLLQIFNESQIEEYLRNLGDEEVAKQIDDCIRKEEERKIDIEILRYRNNVLTARDRELLLQTYNESQIQDYLRNANSVVRHTDVQMTLKKIIQCVNSRCGNISSAKCVNSMCKSCCKSLWMRTSNNNNKEPCKRHGQQPCQRNR